MHTWTEHSSKGTAAMAAQIHQRTRVHGPSTRHGEPERRARAQGSPSTALTGMEAGPQSQKHTQHSTGSGRNNEHWQEAASPLTYGHKTPSQSPASKPLAAHMQTRLPPNSGSPSTAVAASSFSSSLSSSPSPSLNPYTGSLRSMFHPSATNAHVGVSPPTRTSGDGSFPSRNHAGSLLPANIRRASFQQQPRPRTPTAFFTADDLALDESAEARPPRASQTNATAASHAAQSGPILAARPQPAHPYRQAAGDARCEQIVQPR
ncbi:hypothetical protein DL89DRAFT_51227 [Linderina pennispora]|uniref:Uncharacterized protein n=1 Tax=Linderina pennispora TaxID=61395 RepID=A0A1Y1W0J5_9FUNG|nr:uncharacterized protein DL89DRAFT_51227 [Linderina pennispora]ORX67041.1 hypothetical protein DL89DRAFT_51227 [Linderina pennispora]